MNSGLICVKIKVTFRGRMQMVSVSFGKVAECGARTHLQHGGVASAKAYAISRGYQVFGCSCDEGVLFGLRQLAYNSNVSSWIRFRNRIKPFVG